MILNDENFQEPVLAENSFSIMAEICYLHVESNEIYVSQSLDLMACIGVPPIEKELGDGRLNESLSMAVPFPEFESFMFEVSNAIPFIDTWINMDKKGLMVKK